MYNDAILQFFELMHAFKCAVVDDRYSIVTQVATIITHNNNGNKNAFL